MLRPAQPLPLAPLEHGADLARDNALLISLYTELALRHNALVASVRQQCVLPTARNTP